MTAEFTSKDREHFAAIQEYWRQQFGDVKFIPEPYQFLLWLRRYDYRSLKSAVRITAAWVHRRLARHVTHGDDIGFDEDGIVAYCSAVARNTDQAKADAAALQRQGHGTSIEIQDVA